MIYLLYFAWLLLLSVLIWRLPFFRNSGLNPKVVTALFLFRILVSLLSTFLMLRWIPGSDTLTYHEKGIAETKLLLTSPGQFFSELFLPGYDSGYGGFFATSKSFWNNLGDNILLKLLGLLNFLSFGNIFINTLFINFLIFFGLTALYRLFSNIFPAAKKAIIFTIFLLPSVLIFTTVIHKDGLILLSVSMALYHLSFLFKNGFQMMRFTYSLLFLLLVFALRNFVFLALVPALLAWYLSTLRPKLTTFIFSLVYVSCIIFFFLGARISPFLDLPKQVKARQQAFIDISGSAGSALHFDTLSADPEGFIRNLPQAINHSLMRPYIWESGVPYFLPFALEILFYFLLLILFVFYRKKPLQTAPLLWVSFFLSLTMFLIIGYTIPVLGAIVRYRSVFFIFLLIPLVGNIDWQRLRKISYQN